MRFTHFIPFITSWLLHLLSLCLQSFSNFFFLFSFFIHFKYYKLHEYANAAWSSLRSLTLMSSARVSILQFHMLTFGFREWENEKERSFPFYCPISWIFGKCFLYFGCWFVQCIHSAVLCATVSLVEVCRHGHFSIILHHAVNMCVSVCSSELPYLFKLKDSIQDKR